MSHRKNSNRTLNRIHPIGNIWGTDIGCQISHISFLWKRLVSNGTFPNLLMSFSWAWSFRDCSYMMWNRCICMRHWPRFPCPENYKDHGMWLLNAFDDFTRSIFWTWSCQNGTSVALSLCHSTKPLAEDWVAFVCLGLAHRTPHICQVCVLVIP